MALERLVAGPASLVPATAAPAPIVPQQPAGERVFYQDANITITNVRAIMFGTTYALANVTSVKMFVEPRPTAPLILGICLIPLGSIAVTTTFWQILGYIAFIGAAVFLVAWWGTPPKYWVRVGTASGESNAGSFPQPAQTQRVVGALNQAIVHRG